MFKWAKNVTAHKSKQLIFKNFKVFEKKHVMFVRLR